ncbi:CTP synthase [Candidatus Pantoea deserta]|uniref:CTP synthase (glutamine hydrolyzing) n=1 Tax=Candidatus Pantoea deserta TaxID=1869313 RepID=A0A3N4NZ38_9GAMM|nr:CTP synthase [Pantoea deserta]RPE01186.1 CTP synthase [Pantoea deserta]
MSATFILDDALVPARFGLLASLWANQLGLPLWSLRPRFTGDYPDSYQHVAQAGYCVTSGLFRSDTLQQEVSDIARLPARDAVIVLSLADAERIKHLPGRRLYSYANSHPLRLQEGELTLLEHTVAYPRPDHSALRIGLIARERDQRDAYSANLEALHAAAAQLAVSVDIRFLSPAALSGDLHELDDLHGIVLPGGASMASVTAQIAVARASWQRNIPTLGLCLGMQSMCTAAVQCHPGCEEAMLAEVAPDAPLHSFVPFDDRRHRCGLLPFPAAAPFDQMLYNHRYRFNPRLLPHLLASGVRISAKTDDIIEGIYLADHPFWLGVQGHPELQSRPDAPHPLFTAFLQALTKPA